MLTTAIEKIIDIHIIALLILNSCQDHRGCLSHKLKGGVRWQIYLLVILPSSNLNGHDRSALRCVVWSSTVLLDSPLPTGQGRQRQHNYLQAPHYLFHNSLKASLGSQRSMSLPDQQVLVILMVVMKMIIIVIKD